MGGTCVNRGCIPSKVWMRAASLLHLIGSGPEFGIKATVEPPDFDAIINRKNGVASDIRMGMEALNPCRTPPLPGRPTSGSAPFSHCPVDAEPGQPRTTVSASRHARINSY